MKIDKYTIGLIYKGGFFPLSFPLRVTYFDGSVLFGEIVCVTFVTASSRALLTFKLRDESRIVTFYADEITSAVSISDLEVVA